MRIMREKEQSERNFDIQRSQTDKLRDSYNKIRYIVDKLSWIIDDIYRIYIIY